MGLRGAHPDPRCRGGFSSRAELDLASGTTGPGLSIGSATAPTF
jgi:hypothetical protein